MSPKQLVIVIVAVVILAAAFALKQVWLPAQTDTKETITLDGDNKPNKSPLLIFVDGEGVRSEEALTAGHHAFRYRNKLKTPLMVGVNWKNCKCAGVEICVAPDDWKSLDEKELIKRAEDSSLEWQGMDKDGKGFPIPPEAVGWIRLGWKGDKTGDQQFSTDIWVYEADSGLGLSLAVPVHFVEAIRIRAEGEEDKPDGNAGRLNVNDKREVRFLFLSSTRSKFTLEADPPKMDPLVVYGDPVPVTNEELAKFNARPQGPKALSGYRVAITVHERAGERQFDIGPFRRRVAWKSDAVKAPIESHIYGTVLGEVIVASGEKGEPRIDLGPINPNRPAPVDFVLESDNPQVELTLDTDRTVNFLNVESPDGRAGKVINDGRGEVRKRWTVSVTYDPKSQFEGSFPDKDRQGYESTGVVFKISHAGVQNEQERRIKVLVRGLVRPR